MYSVHLACMHIHKIQQFPFPKQVGRKANNPQCCVFCELVWLGLTCILWKWTVNARKTWGKPKALFFLLWSLLFQIIGITLVQEWSHLSLYLWQYYINYSHDLGNISNPLTLIHSVIQTSIRLTMTVRIVKFAHHYTLPSQVANGINPFVPFPIRIKLCVLSSDKLDSGGGVSWFIHCQSQLSEASK